jgi:hypothetical protein
MKNTFVLGRGWAGRTALATCALIGFAAIFAHPLPARARGGVVLDVRQSTGPIGITRGQTARVAVMLPSVQKGTDVAMHGRLLLFAAATGKPIADAPLDLTPGDPACNVDVSVDARGLVIVAQKSGQTAVGQLGEIELRLEVAGGLIASLRTTLDVPPGPCASVQVFNSVNGEGILAWHWFSLPAVQ